VLGRDLPDSRSITSNACIGGSIEFGNVAVSLVSLFARTTFRERRAGEDLRKESLARIMRPGTTEVEQQMIAMNGPTTDKSPI
jgi:hypothetical protein